MSKEARGVVSKAWWAIALFAVTHHFLDGRLARAAWASETRMTDVRASSSPSGTSFDLVFNKPYPAKNVLTSRDRNFIQAVLKSARMTSAKVVPLRNGGLEKVFAYPFAPGASRVRIFSKSDAPPAGAISVWNLSPSVVRIFLKRQAAEEGAGAEAKAMAEILSNTKEIDVHNPDSLRAALENKKSAPAAPKAPQDALAVSSVSKEERSDGSVGIKGDPSRNFLKVFVALGAILAFFGGIVFLLKRYSGKLGKLPFGKKERLIQVVATHYLGNKKSIALVKVTGEYMVVGISNESISLISKIGAEKAVDKYLEERFWNGTFEKHLDSYTKDPASDKALDFSEPSGPEEPKLHPKALAAAAKYDGAKDLLRASEGMQDRVEISKESSVRSGIREKLTNLKPLN